jgi:hypothetical protein
MSWSIIYEWTYFVYIDKIWIKIVNYLWETTLRQDFKILFILSDSYTVTRGNIYIQQYHNGEQGKFTNGEREKIT